MKIGTIAEVRNIDKKAESDFSLPGFLLMESAGRAVFEFIKKFFKKEKLKKSENHICLIAGKGNNGGDAFVVARYLVNNGFYVHVFVTEKVSEKAIDATLNYKILTKMGVQTELIYNEETFNRFKSILKTSKFLIDGILGTGFQGELTNYLPIIIDSINNSSCITVAIDIPSGINGDTGFISKLQAVKADYTITMAIPKIGMFMYPAVNFIGKCIVSDIGIPAQLLKDTSIKQNLITKKIVSKILPKREKNCHKGVAGKAALIGGKFAMAGAVALMARSAIKTGLGIANVFLEKEIYNIVATLVPEAVFTILPSKLKINSKESLQKIIPKLNNLQALAIGPGMGNEPEILDFIRLILKSSKIPLVIDADAINALVGCAKKELTENKNMIMTPHPAELGRLFNVTAKEINENRVYYARLSAKEWKMVCILKGVHTIVALPDGEIFINNTGTPAMATAGTGDVLSGMIVSFLAQGLNVCKASLASVFLHGLAGEMAAKKTKQGLNAMLITDFIPKAIQKTLF